ncbi:hypothetical protein ACVNS2_10725 [Paenibacillus caseinilyticus]|uniref:hypothetical protein n=1 Tax=Paenibacillus mucilaginosus TaxID=61624 RepID=UPI000FFEE43C|nr:hypothetical protein [Paenibacillus mucilaginosus]
MIKGSSDKVLISTGASALSNGTMDDRLFDEAVRQKEKNAAGPTCNRSGICTTIFDLKPQMKKARKFAEANFIAFSAVEGRGSPFDNFEEPAERHGCWETLFYWQ